jgi:Insertion element 4 transposase N-terminal/Transposase DDE domain
MDLATALLEVGIDGADPSFALFARTLDQAWIEAALQATGAASVRRRKLPAEYVVWLVIGMGLFRDRSIAEVVRHLNLVLPGVAAPGPPPVTGGAIVQARDRLGAAPLETLFATTAAHWVPAAAAPDRWRGLAIYGLDGSHLRVPDSPENDETFGRPHGGRGRAGYPQVRLVALMLLRSHLLAGLAVGAWAEGEVPLAAGLWPKLPEASLTILDRGFVSYLLFHQIQSTGPHRYWLTRAKKNLTWRRRQRLGPQDWLIDLPVHRTLRRAHPELPATLPARAIRYHRRGFRPQTLLTSLLDPVRYPAAEIVELYHERWELEIGFDEVKTHTLEREEALRSRAPDRVRQEIWGLAIGYNLVRLEMARVAAEAGVPPRRISYRHTLMLIRNFWLTAWLAPPGALPRRLDALHAELALLLLPPRRSERHFPRAVKIKMSNYPLKRSPRRRRRAR